ncbi:MAG: uroporphyrinogen-III C-methyltransferase [Myxococcales bacterium]|nr:uroporphyrinogen-III C-methyltransferase [Polyangiaceae bacterium]MDW8251994.1 uroporphyrinogen-III C-methyltransferase [Myxococcales bacterium]
MSQGKVYLIGAGPGDPGLITVRGREVLGICDVVLYDALAHPSLLAYLKPGASAEFVGKRGGEESEPQEKINQRLVELARQGKVVGRLKGGDPLLFARGAEEALALAEEKIPFEIVPGISSPVAVSAYAGIPLTHRDLASSVLFLTGTPRASTGPDGHDWQRLATRAGTICVLMGMGRLREIAASLIEHGRPPETPTAVIQWGARPEQRTVVAPLHQIADRVQQEGLGSPALVIIGHVVNLRERLRWFDNKPLFGKRILVTRAREQASVFAHRLREEGAAPIELPTIEIHPPPDPEALARAARSVSTYDWLAFTSANGVARFFDALDCQGLDARALAGVRVAAVGTGTAASLRERGVKADLIPAEFHGEALARALLAFPRPPTSRPWPRVLLPRAMVARDVFPETIRAAGGEVDLVVAYETRPPGESTRDQLRTLLQARAVDLISLTSSSTVSNLLSLLGGEGLPLLAGVKLVSIGPVTTATAEAAGLSVAATASPSTLEGLIDAMKRAIASERPLSSP